VTDATGPAPALPTGWATRAILELVSIANGQVDPRKPQYQDLPLIAPDHIESGTGRLLRRESARSQQAISGKYVVRPGDVVYSKIRPYLEKAFLCGFEALCSADMYPLTPKADVDSSFILHTLLGNDFTAFATSVSARSGIPKLNRAELSEYTLPTPPPGEQVVIAEALDDVDRSIALLERSTAKRLAIKQGIMQQLLTGKTRLPGFAEPWIDTTAGEVGSFKGGSGFPLRFQGAKGGMYPFFKVSDMNNPGNEVFTRTAHNYISEEQRKQMSAVCFPTNSIVFAKVGAAVFLERKRILTHNSCIDNNMAAMVVDSARGDGRFVHYLLTNFPMSSLVATTALPSLNGGQLRSIPLSLPTDIAEQRAIAAVLANADAEIAVLRTRLDKSKAIKQGMKQELLSGRTRLPVLVEAVV
jgi:type I restriction enzyme S subunit